MLLSLPTCGAHSAPQRTQVAFAQTRSTDMDEAYEQEVEQASQAMQRDDFETAFRHLERAHVLAQRLTGRHTYIHWLMLVAGLRRGDLREAVGQVPRIVASILFSRLWVPRGNTGRSRVSAFKPMPVPADLRHLVP
jgi:trans-2-enoyl-CoA reductase